jgi:hypothetical protein
MKWVYAFGSICRGEFDINSDIDLLLISDISISDVSTSKFSIYSTEKIKRLWSEGNPFAWHLHLESKLIFSGNGEDCLTLLGKPSPYTTCNEDIQKFKTVVSTSIESLRSSSLSRTFDAANIFLGIRNAAMCYSLTTQNKPDFTRNSALNLGKASLPITKGSYDTLMKARITSTRGIYCSLIESDFLTLIEEAEKIYTWFDSILEEVDAR